MLTQKLRNKSNPASSWAQWFDRCAKHYDDPRMKMAYYKDGLSGKPVSQKTMTAIYKDVWDKLCAGKDSAMLDVGGGVGMFSQAFDKWVYKIIGTDISPAMIKDAYRLNPNGTFLVCDAAALPFYSGSFDRILCYSVFHYLKDLAHVKKVLNEFVRVVKKDGLIFVGDILTDTPGQKAKKNSKNNIPASVWWPSSLNHSLRKLAIDPHFFIDDCRTRGCRCDILPQRIPGKTTAASRYDVVIQFSS